MNLLKGMFRLSAVLSVSAALVLGVFLKRGESGVLSNFLGALFAASTVVWGIFCGSVFVINGFRNSPLEDAGKLLKKGLVVFSSALVLLLVFKAWFGPSMRRVKPFQRASYEDYETPSRRGPFSGRRDREEDSFGSQVRPRSAKKETLKEGDLAPAPSPEKAQLEEDEETTAVKRTVEGGDEAEPKPRPTAPSRQPSKKK